MFSVDYFFCVCLVSLDFSQFFVRLDVRSFFTQINCFCLSSKLPPEAALPSTYSRIRQSKTSIASSQIMSDSLCLSLFFFLNISQQKSLLFKCLLSASSTALLKFLLNLCALPLLPSNLQGHSLPAVRCYNCSTFIHTLTRARTHTHTPTHTHMHSRTSHT